MANIPVVIRMMLVGNCELWIKVICKGVIVNLLYLQLGTRDCHRRVAKVRLMAFTGLGLRKVR